LGAHAVKQGVTYHLDTPVDLSSHFNSEVPMSYTIDAGTTDAKVSGTIADGKLTDVTVAANAIVGNLPLTIHARNTQDPDQADSYSDDATYTVTVVPADKPVVTDDTLGSHAVKQGDVYHLDTPVDLSSHFNSTVAMNYAIDAGTTDAKVSGTITDGKLTDVTVASDTAPKSTLNLTIHARNAQDPDKADSYSGDATYTVTVVEADAPSVTDDNLGEIDIQQGEKYHFTEPVELKDHFSSTQTMTYKIDDATTDEHVLGEIDNGELTELFVDPEVKVGTTLYLRVQARNVQDPDKAEYYSEDATFSVKVVAANKPVVEGYNLGKHDIAKGKTYYLEVPVDLNAHFSSKVPTTWKVDGDTADAGVSGTIDEHGKLTTISVAKDATVGATLHLRIHARNIQDPDEADSYSDDATYTVTVLAVSDHLTFSQQPANTKSGSAMGSIKIEVQDKDNNKIKSNDIIRLTLNKNTFNDGSSYVEARAQDGVVIFNNLEVDTIAAGYQLTATDRTTVLQHTSTVSSSFNVTATTLKCPAPGDISSHGSASVTSSDGTAYHFSGGSGTRAHNPIFIGASVNSKHDLVCTYVNKGAGQINIGASVSSATKFTKRGHSNIKSKLCPGTQKHRKSLTDCEVDLN